jgi:hypothetical protein
MPSRRHRAHDFDWDEFPVIAGQGSINDLAPSDGETPRLAGLKSVSQAAMWAMHPKAPQAKRHPIGFHTPKRRK